VSLDAKVTVPDITPVELFNEVDGGKEPPTISYRTAPADSGSVASIVNEGVVVLTLP
jgi:hypothetical protein